MDALKTVYHDHPKTALFAGAATLRILLALVFTSLPDLLTDRVEISTPVNSFKRLQEGVFLYERGLDPYDGGLFHQAPLLLPLFSLLPSSRTWVGQMLSILLFTTIDVLCANSLFAIAESKYATSSRSYESPRETRAWQPISVAAVYLLNPFTLLACLGRPSTIFTTFFTVISVDHACKAKVGTSMLALALASYLSLHPAILLPPIGCLCFDAVCKDRSNAIDESEVDAEKPSDPPIANVAVDQRTQPQALPFAAGLVAGYAASLTLLITLSRFFLPSWRFLSSVYMTPLQLPDLTPNPGLWWYFFIEMFDAFRSFFLGVFWLHMLSYSVPLSLRFRRQPLAAVVLMIGIIAIFEPYANIGDVGAWLSCLCLFGHVFELTSTHRYTFPALAALLYGALLGPAFHHLWVYAGSGNANFFYAITLVWNLALVILLTDTIYAVLRDEWESERPEGKGKEIRQV